MIISPEEDVQRVHAIEESLDSLVWGPNEIAGFGDLVHDHSDIHRSTEAAKKVGLRECPVIGAHLYATADRLHQGLLEILKTRNPDVDLIEQRIDFKRPVYVHDKVRWKVVEFGTRDEALVAKVVARGGGDETVLEATGTYANLRPAFQDRSEDQLVYRQAIVISPQNAEAFYLSIGEKPHAKPSATHAAAIVPSVLLAFLGRLNQLAGRKVVGINAAMVSTPYGRTLESGEAQVDIYERSGRGRENKGLYEFEGVVKQGRPVVANLVRCLTNGVLNTRILRPQFGLAT